MNQAVQRRDFLGRSLAGVVVAAGSPSLLGSCLDGEVASNTVDGLSGMMLDLRIPSSKGKNFCKVIHRLSRRDIPEVMYGFVLAEALATTFLQTDDIRHVLITEHDESFSVEEYDFRTYLDEIITSHSGYSTVKNPGYCWEAGLPIRAGLPALSLNVAFRDLVVASWCLDCGYSEDARKLMMRAETTAPRRRPEESLLRQFRHELLILLSKRVVASMANSYSSRAEATARLEWIVRASADGECRERAAELKHELELAKEIEGNLSGLPNQNAVASPEIYVQQLIDQRCDGGLIESGLNPVQGPLFRILEFGEEALPSLKKMSTSRAATRCVIRQLKGVEPYFRWLTVGEVATIIADQIGRDLPKAIRDILESNKGEQ